METIDSNKVADCMVCGGTFKGSEMGILCSKGHCLCIECGKRFIGSLIGNSEEMCPARCSSCKVMLDYGQVEALLEGDQHQEYSLQCTKALIDKRDSEVICCPYCNYFEVWPLSSEDITFVCSNEECGKVSCTACFCEFEFADDLSDEDEPVSHEKCYNLKKIKRDWEQTINKGSQRFCPKCGYGGIKNDACTHMTCVQCKSDWCYICGTSSDKCDKSNPNGNLYRHNDDWETNSKRCPMYLNYIGQVDKRWSTKNDREAKEFLHKLLVSKAICCFESKYSKEELNEFYEAYPEITEDEYDIKGARSMDLRLIIR
ncbi:unnamed protein product [Moneuplotes crassus]|uniref:RING-type domain-containing protein n=1 Tax=Euplotes crassus TaxID=5936 RepID=A0AAD2CWA3_EUPCR|nr:unnamed protein product [Moneuplotes crassus]